MYMFSHLYLTSQLIVDTTSTRLTSSVVMLTVSVRLVERKEKSHVGNVMNKKGGTNVSIVNRRCPEATTATASPEPVIVDCGPTPSAAIPPTADAGDSMSKHNAKCGRLKWVSLAAYKAYPS